jgi:glycosyltransferase involved in cell wall biosynthesis
MVCFSRFLAFGRERRFVNAYREGWIAVIPAYCERGTVANVVRGVLAHGVRPLVIDDGSCDGTYEEAVGAGAEAVRHPCNLGKGAALRTGFARAKAAGFSWIVTLDADGQHDPADLPAFFEAASRDAGDVLLGNRMRDTRAMPLVRRLTNRVMSRWVSRATGLSIPDSQCGYRAFRAAALDAVTCNTEHFEMETEILVRLARRGFRIASVPVQTIYRSERSKIRPFRDTLRFWRMWRALRRETGR